MKRVILLFTMALLVACGNSKKDEAKNYFEGYSLKPVPFLGKKVQIPNSYKKVNLNELGEMLRQNPNQNPLDLIYLRMAKTSQKETNKVAVLYEDTITKGKSIYFVPAAYLKLDKSIVNEYVNLLEGYFLPQLEEQGVVSERLEAKYLTINGGNAIKVKFKQFFEEKQQYFTQYIFTKDLETYSINIVNTNEEDYQKILKSL